MVMLVIGPIRVMERCTDCNGGYQQRWGSEHLCETCGGNGWYEIEVHVNRPVRVPEEAPW